VDQFNDSNYSEDNNQNQRPANPYLRPTPPQGQANKPDGYIPAWPATGPEAASGGPDRNPFAGTPAQPPTSNPYQTPTNPYQKVESPYVSSGGAYTYRNAYPQNAGAATEQPRRVILGATLNRSARWTQILLGIIVLFFVGQMLTGGSLLGDRVDELTIWGALTKPGVVQGEWWRLVTSMFLHVGILHILFNGIALFALGMQAEQLMGSKRFLLIFFLTGIGGNILTLLLNPVPSVGASGGIFGLLGALVAFFYRNRDRLGAWGHANLRSLLFTVGINFFITISIPQVNQLAHLGGLLTGLFLGYFFSPWHIRRTIGPGTRALTYRLQDFVLEWWPVPALIALELLMFYLALQGNQPGFRLR
jgi:rhomboid protease GluP